MKRLNNLRRNNIHYSSILNSIYLGLHMKIYLIVFIFLLVSYSECSAQKNTKSIIKLNLDLDLGLHYSKIFNAKATSYYSGPCGSNISCNNRVSFKDKSTMGYQFGFRFITIHSKAKLLAGTGLYYYKRNSLSEGNKDSVLNYYPVGSNPTYKNVETARNLEAPIFIGYTLKQFQFSVGLNLLILSNVVNKEWFIDDTQYHHKIDYSYRLSNTWKPFIKVDYSLPLNKYNNYFGVNLSIEKLRKDNYALILGLFIPINNKK